MRCVFSLSVFALTTMQQRLHRATICFVCFSISNCFHTGSFGRPRLLIVRIACWACACKQTNTTGFEIKATTTGLVSQDHCHMTIGLVSQDYCHITPGLVSQEYCHMTPRLVSQDYFHMTPGLVSQDYCHVTPWLVSRDSWASVTRLLLHDYWASVT